MKGSIFELTEEQYDKALEGGRYRYVIPPGWYYMPPDGGPEGPFATAEDAQEALDQRFPLEALAGTAS